MSKHFSFKEQLAKGREGELKVIELLSCRGNVDDLTQDMEYQRNGIDLYAECAGWVEVKTDFHKPVNLFLEITDRDGPGALFSSCASSLAYLFPNHKLLLLMRRAAVAHWMMQHWCDIQEQHPEWIKHITSCERDSTWQVIGVTVPIEMLEQDIHVERMEWE